MKRTLPFFGGLAAFATVARAHTGNPAPPPSGWEFDPWIVVPLFITFALYGAGISALRRATGRPRKLRREAWLFMAGWTSLAVALVSPVHTLSGELFWVHMTQHELLMIVAAPLLILGRPAIAMSWAIPGTVLRAGRRLVRGAGLGLAWRVGASLWGATLVHAAALWIWHVPALFDATLRHEGVHALQHVSFVGTALLFWHAVFYGRHRAAGYGVAVLMLFVTAGHSGALGALLTFASNAWYAGYANPVPGRPLTPLEDQQLGGLIMWVPAGLVYVAAGLALFAAWLRQSGPPRNRGAGSRTAVDAPADRQRAEARDAARTRAGQRPPLRA